MKSKLTIYLLSLTILSGCSKNEAEYYGYVKKEDGLQKKELILSPSELISSAIRNDDWPTIEQQLNQGLSPNTILDSGRTLLNESVLWDRVEIFKKLLDFQANPSLKDPSGFDTLQMCEDKINFLIILDPSLRPTFENEFFGYLESEDTDELKRMLEQNFNPNFLLTTGETPLVYSVVNNYENNVRLLINPSFKVDLNARDSTGKSALAWAKDLNLTRIERILLARGAQP